MFSHNLSRKLMITGLSLAMILALALSGCSNKSQLSDTTTTQADAITVTSSPTSISTGVTTVIEALVTADGAALADEIVTFSVSPVSLGTVTPGVDTTDAAGIAATVFTPSGSGTVIVTASTGGGTVLGTTTITVAEGETSGGNGFVWVTLTPDTLRTGEEGSSAVRIEVRDSLQQIPAESTVVVIQAGENFTDTDGDGYYTPGSDQLLDDFNSNGWWDPVGTVDSIAYTDASGLVNLVYTGTSADARTIYVRATLRDSLITGFDKTALYFEPYSSDGGAVAITSSAPILVANGTDTVVLTIQVKDASLNNAPESTLVRLTAGEKFLDSDDNGYFTPGVDQVLVDVNNNGWWDSLGSIPAVAYTDANGVANVTYTAGSSPFDVYIRAKVIDTAITASREFQLTMSPSVDLHSIFLYSDSMHVSVIQTGGIQTAILHAIAYDVWGDPVPAGYPIVFTITAGPGGGEHLYDVATGYGPYNAITDSEGHAAVPFTAGTVSGTVRLRAVSGTTLSNSTQILVSAGPPKYIMVAADTCNVPSWLRVDDEVLIVALVSDTFLNPVNDSIMVYFSSDEGTMKSHEERTLDLEGRASTIWMSNQIPTATSNGEVWIWAETDGGTVIDSNVFLSTGPPAVIWAVDMPVTMPLVNTIKEYFWLYAEDINGHPVIEGTEYSVETRYVNIPSGTFSGGCVSAWSRGEITSTTLTADYSMPGGNDDGIGAVERVGILNGPDTDTTYDITLTTGVAYSGQSLLSTQTAAAWGETIDVTATIKDYYGNPLGDHTLVLSAVSGAVTGATQETNTHGMASGFKWTAPNADGTYTITITDTDPRGGIIMNKQITVSNN